MRECLRVVDVVAQSGAKLIDASGGASRLVDAGSRAVLADRVEIARSVWSRLRGLIGRDPMDGTALFLPRTRQVHTFGMKVPIDVVFCDRTGLVVRVYRGLRPRRVTSVVRGARSALEFVEGGAAEIRVGMLLVIR